MVIRKILLLVAMNKEAQPIINKMQMQEINSDLDKHLPASVYEANTEKGKTVLVVSGICPTHNVDRIGSQGLNLLAWEAIKTFTPDIIVNVGTGGGFKKNGSQPGDIYVSSQSIKYHDRLFFPDLHFLNYGIGSFKCLEIPHLAKKLGLKQGVISSGGSMLASTQEERQMEQNQAVVKEMEAAGIAEVAQLKGIPFIALKIITDLVDTNDCPQNQFTNNFNKVISHLSDKVDELCSMLMGADISEICKSVLNTDLQIMAFN